MTQSLKRIPRCSWCQWFVWYYEQNPNGQFVHVNRGRCTKAGKEALPTRPVHDCLCYRRVKGKVT